MEINRSLLFVETDRYCRRSGLLETRPDDLGNVKQGGSPLTQVPVGWDRFPPDESPSVSFDFADTVRDRSIRMILFDDRSACYVSRRSTYPSFDSATFWRPSPPHRTDIGVEKFLLPKTVKPITSASHRDR